MLAMLSKNVYNFADTLDISHYSGDREWPITSHQKNAPAKTRTAARLTKPKFLQLAQLLKPPAKLSLLLTLRPLVKNFAQLSLV